MNHHKYRNVMVSIILITIWTTVILFLSANSDNELGAGFSLYSWLMISRFIALAGAGVLFLLRVSRLINRQTNFFYSFFATLNVCIGLLGVVLYFCIPLNQEAIHEFLLNLLAGVVLMVDIFFLSLIFKRA